MNIHEYQAKELLRAYQVTTPAGKVARDAAEAVLPDITPLPAVTEPSGELSATPAPDAVVCTQYLPLEILGQMRPRWEGSPPLTVSVVGAMKLFMLPTVTVPAILLAPCATIRPEVPASVK